MVGANEDLSQRSRGSHDTRDRIVAMIDRDHNGRHFKRLLKKIQVSNWNAALHNPNHDRAQRNERYLFTQYYAQQCARHRDSASRRAAFCPFTSIKAVCLALSDGDGRSIGLKSLSRTGRAGAGGTHVRQMSHC